MAYEITRLLPFRQYNDTDVINFYSLDAETGEAGSVVKVSAADLQNEPVQYVQRGDSDSWQTTMGNALSMYPEVPYKLTKVSDTGAGVKPLGILLRDVRNKDENGENLLYYPQKKEELQCVVSGEAVPVATKGLFTVNVKGLGGGIAPTVNQWAIPSLNGTVSGVTATAANHATLATHSIGQFIATGHRGEDTLQDAFSGSYAILNLNC